MFKILKEIYIISIGNEKVNNENINKPAIHPIIPNINPNFFLQPIK